MLEGLDSIDWAHIQHSHGTAEEFPRWIRELRSDDAEIRDSARENLIEYSFHQQSIYQVTAYLVPFLIELVAAPDTPDRGLLLNHIGCVAEAGEEMNVGVGHEDLARAACASVEAGREIYQSLLSDPDPEVRLNAFLVLSVLEGPVWDKISQLVGVAQRETVADNLTRMIDALAWLARDSIHWGRTAADTEPSEALLSFLAERIGASSRRVRFPAAMAYLGLAGQVHAAVARDIAAVMADMLAHPGTVSLDNSLPYFRFTLRHALNSLEYLPRARRLAILAGALQAAQFAQDAHTIGRALLDTVFFGALRGGLREKPSTPPAALAALPAEDRKLLRLVLDTDLVWMVHSNLLEAYGLPVHRDEARALLDSLG